jgi:S-adenosylmethionine hydrolase
VTVDKFGEEITDFMRFTVPKAKQVSPSQVKGVVIKVDKFGNLMTNIKAADAPKLFGGSSPNFRISIGKQQVSDLKKSYAEGRPGELFAILGSSGFLEVSTNRGSAARIAGADKGAEVTIDVS